MPAATRAERGGPPAGAAELPRLLVVCPPLSPSLNELAAALEGDRHVVYRVSSLREALAAVAGFRPHLALIHMGLDDGGAERLCRALLLYHGAPSVLVYASEDEHLRALALFRAGARDCFPADEHLGLAAARITAALR